MAKIEHWKPVAEALLREYGWEPRIVGVGDPGGYEGWERIAKTALEASNPQGAVEALDVLVYMTRTFMAQAYYSVPEQTETELLDALADADRYLNEARGEES